MKESHPQKLSIDRSRPVARASQLEGIVAESYEYLSDLPIMSETERYQLLVKWNATETHYPRNQCIHELFEAQAERTPDAMALVFQDQHLTFRELNRRANQLAHHLHKLGVGAEVLAGICVERSLEMIVGLLGILKAGGAYVPLDPTHPREQIAFRLADTRAPVLLTQAHLQDRLPHTSPGGQCQGPPIPNHLHLSPQVQVTEYPTTIYLDDDWAQISRETNTNPANHTQPDNLAYVMYTSGSTGRPKGASITHRNVVRLVRETNFADLTSQQIFFQFASNAFDAATLEIWGSLLNGARLVISDPQMPSLEELGQTLQRHQVTTLWLTAGLFHLMVDERLEDLRSLCQLLAGGDVLSVPHVHKVLRELPECRMINGYGPTENTTFTCCYPLSSQRWPSATVPIGRPIANTQVYVLDRDLQPVPVGVPGELYAAGDGLARGYWDRPRQTAAAFVPNPFAPPAQRASPPLGGSEGGKRLYRTGDLARWLPDGNIEFLGRGDDQVKIRGFRIELGEVQAALGGHPAVRETVVVARQDDPGDNGKTSSQEKRLVAYVVQEDQGPTTGDLRRFLEEKLPDYMIPSAFVFLDALPLTSNGKIDREALPPPALTRPQLEEDFVAPRTRIERQLAEIWSQVLGYEQIGVHDNFFHLGGHSLASAQVMARVLETLSVEMSPLSVFEAPTIAHLAENVGQAGHTKPGQDLPPLEPALRNGPPPLTFAQEQVWFLQELTPGNIAYNAQITIRFKGHLDVTVLEQVLTEIVRRHEVLRTTFPAVDERPVQLIHSPWPVTLGVVDLRVIPEDRREVTAESLISGAFEQPFDTTRLPLIRWTLLKLGAQDHILVQIEHHFVHDGWSFSVFFREMQALYEAFSAGRPSPLPELPIQYSDLAVWQRRWMQGDMAQAQLAYWERQLTHNPPVLELPADRPRPKAQNLRGASHRVALPQRLYEALKALSLEEGATLFMTLLTAFKTLLYHYTGQEDLPVGSSVANRRLPKTEALIGMIVNMVVLRTDLSGDPTFRELLGRVRQVALEAYAHQDFPFGKLVEALQPERDLSRNALFQVGFNFHDSPVPELAFSGLTGSIEYRQNESAKFDLNVLVIPRAEQLIGSSPRAAEAKLTVVWEYDTDLFDAGTIRRMADHFEVLLESIVASPERRLSDFSLLTEAERHQLLVAWNDTRLDYPQDSCIHELFEAQVARTPEATALIYEDQRLSYRDLDQRANQLAHYLRELGVGPELLVGVCAERSVEMVVALLGVLKAGAAYVPLDPAYPQERIAFMLEDAHAAVLLTQSQLLDQLPARDVRTVCLDTDWETIAAMPHTAPSCTTTSDNLAYTIYTSGSTGKPKGVQIIHRAVANFLETMRQRPGLTKDDTLLSVTTISFDIAVLELFMPLTTGARVVLVSAAVAADGFRLLETLATSQATLMQATPATWRLLLAAGWPGDARLKVLCGGEALPRELADQLVARGASLWNLYGPTETTVWSTLHRVQAQDGPVSIGRPIANTALYLLDRHLRPVPVGVSGELYIGGDGLARGYLGRPKLTAEKFVPNPFPPPSFPPPRGG